jgi:hypothetical protein
MITTKIEVLAGIVLDPDPHVVVVLNIEIIPEEIDVLLLAATAIDHQVSAIDRPVVIESNVRFLFWRN